MEALLLLIKPSKQKEESNIIHTGITSKTRFIDNDFITIKKDTVYVREKENIALKSLKNEVKEITQYKTMVYDNSNFVVYIDQEKNILKNVLTFSKIKCRIKNEQRFTKQMNELGYII